MLKGLSSKYINVLLQAEGSALAAKFNGNWAGCLDRDDEGHIFLDFDPDLFQYILSYLRACTICSGTKPAPPQISSEHQLAYGDLVRCLLLEEFMGCLDTALQPSQLTIATARPGLSICSSRQAAHVQQSSDN